MTIKNVRRNKNALGPFWKQFNDQRAFTEIWKRFMRAKKARLVLLGKGKSYKVSLPIKYPAVG